VDPSRILARAGFLAIALSTALVIAALAVLPFLTSAFVGFEQSRTGAASLTRYSPTELRNVTDAILVDLVVGPPDFDVEVDGRAVLTEPERSHMRDVRLVFTGFFLVAAAGFLVLVAAFAAASRRGRSRRDAWRGVRAGALGLAIGTVAAGVVALVAFDVAFEVFHRLFFASGTYLFDPATSRLVQLFPDAFWSETAIAVGGVIIVLAAGVAWLAGRRVRAGAAGPVAAGGPVVGRAEPPPPSPAGERGPAR
jgi:integral membrane protein (TIGR01906 family)